MSNTEQLKALRDEAHAERLFQSTQHSDNAHVLWLSAAQTVSLCDRAIASLEGPPQARTCEGFSCNDGNGPHTLMDCKDANHRCGSCGGKFGEVAIHEDILKLRTAKREAEEAGAEWCSRDCGFDVMHRRRECANARARLSEAEKRVKVLAGWLREAYGYLEVKDEQHRQGLRRIELALVELDIRRTGEKS